MKKILVSSICILYLKKKINFNLEIISIFFYNNMEISTDYLKTIFPENDNLHLIQSDEEGLFSVSSKNVSKFICNIIKKYLRTSNYNEVIITDATAGIGGNTIGFMSNYGVINAVECNIDRFNYLQNNINLYKSSNNIVNFYHNDYLEIYKNLEQDIIFFDPPWGGKDYKSNENINLYLSNKNIIQICNDVKDYTNLIVLKVPKNFNIKSFISDVNYKFLHIHKLNKMDILVIENYGNS
jgi:16S rRNA G966 N2-methylase RsmD